MASNKIGNLSVQLGVQLAGFESDMKRAARISKKETERIKKQMVTATKAIALGALGASVSIGKMVSETAKLGDQLSKTSQKLGVSVGFLSRYDFIAGQAGTNIETVSTAIKKMQKSINDANNGLTTSIRAFDSLGISLDELNQLSPEEQFRLITQSMSKVETQSVLTGSAMDIFGRAGTELIPLLKMTTKETDDLTEAQVRFGASVNDVQSKAAVDYTDAIDELHENVKGFTNTLGFALMPALTAIAENFNDSTVREAGDDWEILNSIIIGTYSTLLNLNAVFETVGNAVGQIAAKSISSFKLLATGFESFIKRVNLGSAILASAFSDDAAADVKRLDKEIADLDQQYEDLLSTISTQPDTTIIEDLNKLLLENEKKVNKVKKAWKDYSINVKKTNKVNNDVKKDLDSLNETIVLTQTEIDKLNKDYEKIADSFLSPSAKLKKEYDEQISKIQEWQDARIAANKDLGESNLLILEATEAYEKNTKALESQLTPYEQLIQSMNLELSLLRSKGGALNLVIAEQELARAGIIRAELTQEQYNIKLQEYLGLLEQINAENGTFGNGINNITDLLSKAFSGDSFFKDMSDGFKSMTSDAENFADGLASIGDFANFIADSFNSNAGKDDVGQALNTINDIAATGAFGPIAQAVAQVASFIDQLTGGGLFGTSYAVTGSSQDFGIGQTGGTGSTSVSESRKKSLFRGTQRRTTESPLTAEAQQAIDSLFDNIQAVFSASVDALNSNLTDIITGSFNQTFDKDGNLLTSISTVLGQAFNEDFAAFSQRLIAENIISVVDSVLTELTNEASNLAQQFRNDSSKLLEFSQFALVVAGDLKDGNGLLSSLTDTTSIIQELGKVNETLTESYERIKDSTLLFESALELIGQSLDVTREDFIRFSVDIAEAAGGLEQAAGLWESYFDTFYSTQELLDQAIASATNNRNDLLGGLDLDSNITPQAFRELFETLLPDLSADGIVQWLRAADAIGLVIDLTSDMTEALEEQAVELALMMAGIASSLEDMDLSNFSKSLKDIKNAFNEQIATAKKLGASEKELAMIQRFAARQIALAIAELESSISSSIGDLYGTGLDAINEQITALQTQISLNEQINQANIQRYQAELQALKNIADFVDSLFLNASLTTLNPLEQLNNAQAQFDALFAAAQGGDVDALNALPNIANILLGLGRDVFASSTDYTALFDSITSQLGSLGLNGSSGQPAIIPADPRLIELMEQQTALQEQIASGERFTAVLALAEEIAELTSVTGESFSDLAERLGLPIEQFITDLGVNLEELTVDTATALADVAQLLGIELSELAESVGVSLGELADANSLLNDALENVIGGLPEGIQASLTPLLENVETAADGTEQVEALQVLTDFVDSLAEDQRDALAPFFDQIDPTSDAQRQIDTMTSIDTLARENNAELIDMNTSNQRLLNESVEEQRLLRIDQQETSRLLQLVIDQLAA